MRANDVARFILAREEVRQLKEAGHVKPWTDDKILQRYRFCNVRREDDIVTRWIAKNWREPNADNPHNWFAMAVARWINWPDTLAAIGYPIPFRPTAVINAMRKRKNAGEKLWTGAYMIGTQGNAKDKILFIVEDVLAPMYQRRAYLKPNEFDTLESFNKRLQECYAMKGGFMGGQIIADIKYTDKHLLAATDWKTWAVSGPGSRRGLNRVIGNDVDAPWREAHWQETMKELWAKVDKLLPKKTLHHMQDLQNCLCEFDKYERVRLGEGTPRSLYPGV